MKNYRTVDDISSDKRIEDREKFKKDVSEDVDDVLEKIFPKKERESFERKFSFFKWFGTILLLLFLTTFILGCFWLIKFFLTNIF